MLRKTEPEAARFQPSFGYLNPHASDIIKPLNSQQNCHAPSGRTTISLFLAPAFLVLVVLLAFTGSVPYLVPAWYLIIGAFTLALYAADKSAARKNQRRLPENTLHLCSLLGGWPGALIGQQVLRHKSRKTPFLILFWATVVVNCAALAWLLWYASETEGIEYFTVALLY